MDRDEGREMKHLLDLIESDLELSREVQELLLPSTRPVIQGYAFFDYFQATTHVGGSYYDYIRLADGRLVVVVADIVGHGIAAALTMAKLSGEVRFCLASESDPAIAATLLNNRMCPFGNRFLTLLIVTLDPKSHEATIVNAGHLSPILRRLDASLSRPGVEAASIPIGIVEEAEYVAATVTLQPGESLTLFTDGFSDATNMAGHVFTSGRMCEIVAATNGIPSEIGNSLLTQLRQHLGDQPLDDDVCLISFGPVTTAQVP